MSFPVRHYAMYRKCSPKKAERHAIKGATYFPKYSHYINRKSSRSFYPESEYIKTYKKSILIFAIQDSFSRFIVHTCLKEQPTSELKNLPWWFDVKECFEEAFETYGKPFEIVLDRHVERKYSEFLEQNCKIVTGAKHSAYSASLERFFLSVQYGMRTELTESNFKKYIQFYTPNLGLACPICSGIRPHQNLQSRKLSFPPRDAVFRLPLILRDIHDGSSLLFRPRSCS